jgi:hypothetical protein
MLVIIVACWCQYKSQSKLLSIGVERHLAQTLSLCLPRDAYHSQRQTFHGNWHTQ